MVDVQTISVAVAATSVVAFVVNSIIMSRKAEKTQELALKAQQHNLETRQAQLFMGLYQSLYCSDFTQAEFLLFKIEMKNVGDMEKLMKENVDEYRAWNMYGTFYEGLGVLVRENLIDVRLVAELMLGMVIQFWSRFKIVELNKEVIKMVAPQLPKDRRFEVVHGDFFKVLPDLASKGELYDTIIMDIWTGEDRESIPDFKRALALVNEHYPQCLHLFHSFQKMLDTDIVNSHLPRHGDRPLSFVPERYSPDELRKRRSRPS